jgi:hypothetical protein
MEGVDIVPDVIARCVDGEGAIIGVDGTRKCGSSNIQILQVGRNTIRSRTWRRSSRDRRWLDKDGIDKASSSMEALADGRKNRLCRPGEKETVPTETTWKLLLLPVLGTLTVVISTLSA